VEALRQCKDCNKKAYTRDDLDTFCKDKEYLYGRKNLCISCQSKRARKSEKKKCPNGGYHRNKHLVRKYGITLEQYDKMYKEQNGKCKICNTKDTGGSGTHFAIDHNHKTGEVRGLLCQLCNTGLGMFRDSEDLLISAIKYLK